jgi:DNA-binding CsgD family transcriptional regulator
MPFDLNTATAILSGLRLANEHGGVQEALRATGVELPGPERLKALSDAFGDVLGRWKVERSVGDAMALGFLAGRAAHVPRMRRAADPTSFVMDRDLVCRAADGESILRLPWFEDGLFVGRQIPDISEMPRPVRALCVEHYSAALAGERRQFVFVSYGHTYAVDAVPVHDYDGTVQAVLGIATPDRSYAAAARGYEKTAKRLERAAARAEQHAQSHRLAGRSSEEMADLRAARKARRAAEQAWTNARNLHARAARRSIEAPSITPRETEVLQLASHGLTAAEIAAELVVSVGTVKTHLQNIYPKLGVSEKASAVATALRHGLID